MIPNEINEISINTSHIQNFYTLLSALFRQKESCHPYWYFKYIYIYLYIFEFQRILEIPICTCHLLNTHAFLYFFQIKRVLPPILAYYKYINIIYMVPINIFEIPIDTSYELNTYALLSVNLRQKESCDRYLYIYIEKKRLQKNYGNTKMY